MEFNDLKTQYDRIGPAVNARIDAVLRHGQYIQGPEVARLEQALSAWTGSEECIGCSSGTDALLIALMALEIGAGDEVITTPFSFAATAETIALAGAAPVFVDIDPLTFNLAPDRIEAAITQHTRAIMPVSLYGQCADMDRIGAIATRYGLPVIEDAAQSFGATHHGRASCNVSVIGCTSFFPSKPLGCYGDGGACFTNDPELAERMREVRSHGQKKRYHHVRLGINGRLDTLQAAILLAKIEVFGDEVEARSNVAAVYDALLSSHVQTPWIAAGNRSVYAQYTVRTTEREALQRSLQSAGIPTAIHYPLPLHLQPAFAAYGAGQGSLPHAERAAREVLSLPMHPYLSVASQEQVAATVCHAVGEFATA